ncbi:hypothetical protein, partial [Candidatus Ichthyocystis sparus]|uniref:hypothetical protein n=1 Tax=Candidatus Ichthyocystis sparus TaxID=1561004 RepID=UPI00159EC5A7
TRSFIRNVIYTYEKHEIDNKKIADERHLKIESEKLKENLVELFKNSVVLIREKIVPPEPNKVNRLVNNLISDMSTISNIIETNRSHTTTRHESTFSDMSESYVEDMDVEKIEDMDVEKSNYSEASPNLGSAISPAPLQIDQQHPEMPEELNLVSKSYNRIDIFSENMSMSVYGYLIKKVSMDSIDSDRLRNRICSLLRRKVIRGITASDIKIDTTLLNIKQHIVHKICSEAIKNKEIELSIISPGMNLADIVNKCLLNKFLLNELHDYCKKIKRNIDQTVDKKVLSLIQKQLDIATGNIEINLEEADNCTRAKISKWVRSLIKNNTDNLCINIKSLLENNFNQHDVFEGMFTTLHGVTVEKSLIRKVAKICSNGPIGRDTENYCDIKIKIEEAVRKSTILHEGRTFLPNEYTVASLIDNLLSDITTDTIDTKRSPINEDETTEEVPENTSSCSNEIEAEVCTDHVMEDSYRISNLMNMSGLTLSIYGYAVKKMELRNKRVFEESMLQEFGINEIPDNANIRLSTTYSKVIDYIADKVYPYIMHVSSTEDVSIKPGMSVSEIHNAYISNDAFFEKIQKSCSIVEKELRKTNHELIFPIIPSSINFNGRRLYTKITTGSEKRKNKFASILIDFMSYNIENLPQIMKDEITNLTGAHIISNVFAQLHGAYVPKSFARKIEKISIACKLMSERNQLRLDLIEKKLKSAVDKSLTVVHKERIFFPNKNTKMLMANHLILDIRKSLINDSTCHGPWIEEATNSSTSAQNSNHVYQDLKSPMMTRSIYEWATEKINIEEDTSLLGYITTEFKNEVVEQDDCSQSLINLSTVYSKIIDLIYEKTSQHIDSIMRVCDISITPSMSISDIKRKCINNYIFFCNLHEYCKEIASDISKAPCENFINILKPNNKIEIGINVDSEGEIKILQKLKCFIIDIMLDLPHKIIATIDRLGPSDISEAVFTQYHGIKVTKSFIRNAIEIYEEIVREIRTNQHLKFDDIIREQNDRLGCIIRNSPVLVKETALLPDGYTIELILNGMVLDMTEMYNKYSQEGMEK